MKQIFKNISLLGLILNFAEVAQAQSGTTTSCPGNPSKDCVTGSYTSQCQFCCNDGGWVYCTCPTGKINSASQKTCQNTRIEVSKCSGEDISLATDGSGYLQCGSHKGDSAHDESIFACNAAPAPYYCGGAYLEGAKGGASNDAGKTGTSDDVGKAATPGSSK